jgi:FkbM family methyltransferase
LLSDLQTYTGYKPEELALLDEFKDPSPMSEAGFVVDFVGTRIAADILWKQAGILSGQLAGMPIPGDFHAEAIEWIGVLKAVKAASERFTVLELGAGFGTWGIGSAVVARRRGIRDISIHTIEGDPRHCASALKHFRNNGFDPNQHDITNAAVGTENGVAQWPRMSVVANEDGWSFRPKAVGEVDYLGRSFAEMMDIQVIALRDLLFREPEWSLVHCDVQGHEVLILQSCLDEVNERVRWLVVGTHSRKIDGDLMDLMYRAGWHLENEKPTKFLWNTGFPTLEGMAVLDGTQVWRNPRPA